MVTEWPKILIGDVLDFKNGLNKAKTFFGHGTPIINYTDVYHNSGLRKHDIKGTVELTTDELRRYAVKKNDVFFTRTSETPEEVGLSAVLLDDIDDCAFSGFILRGRPKNDWLLGEYCQYCFSTQQVRDEIISNCTYTTRALTNGKVLSAIEIPLPPKPEQKAITEMISAFDTYIDDLSELIEKKKGIRDGALEDLVSGKTRLDRYAYGKKETFILGALTKVKRGKRVVRSQLSSRPHDTERNPVYQNSLYPLGYCNMTNCKARSAFVIAAGNAGDIGFSDSAFWAADDCYYFEHNEDIDQKFLYYALKYSQQYLYAQTRRTSIPRLSRDILENMELWLPVLSEQEAVAAVLTAMDEEIEALQVERDKMMQIREGAMDDLLTGRVRLSV